MEFINILGLVAGVCTSSSVIPQIITTIKKKKAAEVSLAMFIVLMTGNALWIYYGITKGDFAIAATNAFSEMLNVVMLVLKYRYRR
jgi:MtN3 and saliva related transmembrane protein